MPWLGTTILRSATRPWAADGTSCYTRALGSVAWCSMTRLVGTGLVGDEQSVDDPTLVILVGVVGDPERHRLGYSIAFSTPTLDSPPTHFHARTHSSTTVPARHLGNTVSERRARVAAQRRRTKRRLSGTSCPRRPCRGASAAARTAGRAPARGPSSCRRRSARRRCRRA